MGSRKKFCRRILLVVAATLALQASAWNSYSEPSLQRVQSNQEQRVPTAQASPLHKLIVLLKSSSDDQQRRAALTLVLEVEKQVLHGGDEILSRPGVARTLALAEWDRLMTAPETLDLSDRFKNTWREVVSDRFTTEAEFVVDAVGLELSRRKQALKRPFRGSADSQPLALFRQQLLQSLMTPIPQRVAARAFWNLTEEAFTRLQTNCQPLALCEEQFSALIETMGRRGELDRPASEKLRAIFSLRKMTLRDLHAMRGQPAEETRFAKGAYDPKLLTLGLLAAENSATSLAATSLSPQALIIALGAFFTAFLISLVLRGPAIP